MSRHRVDPELLPLIDAGPALSFSDSAIPGIRQMLESLVAGAAQPSMHPKRVQAVSTRHPEGVGVLVFDPPDRTNRAAVLQIHGGGMVLGSAAWSSQANADLASELDVLVVSVDYRLAPENPFPLPQYDCLTAYEWMINHSDELGVDADRIVIAGESAGGGLAAATALMIRDLALPPPCLQVLTYPMLDHRTGGNEKPGFAGTGDFVWTRDMNRYCWGALRGAYGLDDARSGWFSPALAASLADVAPAFMATGALDLFLEENIEYSRRLCSDGVGVELHVYPGAVHAFDQVPSAAVSRAYQRDKRAAISRALAL